MESHRPSLSPDRPPVAGKSTGNEALMEVLLYMSSRMHAMDEHVSQHEQDDCKQPQEYEAVMRSSPRSAACSAGSSKEPPTKEEDGHISESVRRKLATSSSKPTCLQRVPQRILIQSKGCTDG